jgi:transcriptional regulator with XRE-family HTH domain
VAEVKKYRKLLGNSIRRYRKKAKLTQEKLAELAELNEKYIGDVERGQENISFDALIRLAKALKISLSKLLHGI